MSTSQRFRWLLRHPGLTFVGMCIAFVASGSASYGLVALISANLRFLLEHGWQAVMAGGLFQLIQLLVLTAVAVFGYLAFKICEHALVQRFAQTHD